MLIRGSDLDIFGILSETLSVLVKCMKSQVVNTFKLSDRGCQIFPELQHLQVMVLKFGPKSSVSILKLIGTVCFPGDVHANKIKTKILHGIFTFQSVQVRSDLLTG